jgi:hypothetical protein
MTNQQRSIASRSGSFSESNCFERPHHESDSHDHLLEPLSERVIVGGGLRNLIHRYINHEIGICLHFHSWDIPGESEAGDLAMVFQKAVAGNPNGLEHHSRREVNHGAGVRGPRTDDVKLSMPVFPRPVIQNPKAAIHVQDDKFGRELFGSIVRLYRLDKSPTLLREWLNLPSGIAEFGRPGANGKLQTVLMGGRVLSALDDGSLIDTSIQSGPQMIERLSQFESAGRGKIVRWMDANSSCPIVLHVYKNVVEVFFDKVIPDFGQGFAVSDCPFDTIPDSIECPPCQYS